MRIGSAIALVTVLLAGLVAGAAPAAGPAPTAAETPIPFASAPPSTSASIAPSLSPDRLHAKAALTFAIAYAGGELGVPSPIRKAVLSLPAGLTLNVPVLRSCSAALLLARGVSGCPAQSEIGTGHAVTVANLGAQPIVENLKLLAFLGAPRNLEPTFVILGEGSTPLSVEMVLTATAFPDRAPYGEKLAMSIPPISTAPGQPDASVVDFSLTIGASGPDRPHLSATVSVPSRCPRGGLPFAAAFTYADGSRGSALATVPCPT